MNIDQLKEQMKATHFQLDESYIGTPCPGIRKIKQVSVVEVDGIEVPLTEDQIKFIEDSKRVKEQEEEKFIVNLGDILVRVSDRIMSIFNSTRKFDLREETCFRKATIQEIAVWENRNRR